MNFFGVHCFSVKCFILVRVAVDPGKTLSMRQEYNMDGMPGHTFTSRGNLT